MQKIKNMHQLQEEKQRIRSKQLLLENKIREEYAGLSSSLKPMNIVKQALSSITSQENTSTAESGSTKKMFVYGLATMAATWLFKKGRSKVRSFFSRK